jgi:hypothetical protein
MSNEDLKTILNPRDRFALDATSGTSWVPKEPREVLLPYIEKGPDQTRDELDTRRAKAKEIYDGYGEIAERAKELRDEIADRCKNVTVTLNPSIHGAVIAAVKRVFGTDGRQITFQMYQKAITEMSALANSNIPKPGDK